MNSELDLDPADIQQGYDEAKAKAAAKPPKPAKKDGKDGKTTKAKSTPPIPKPTPPVPPTLPPPTITLDRYETRIVNTATENLNDWWIDTGRSAQVLSLRPIQAGTSLTATADWSDGGRDFRATFTVANGWKIEVSIETMMGWKPVGDPTKINEVIQEEAKLKQELGKLFGAWCFTVGMPNPLTAKGDLSNKTVYGELINGLGKACKFIGVAGKDSLHVKLVPEYAGQPEIDINDEDEYEAAVTNPPQLTPDDVLKLQALATKAAIDKWLGGTAPTGYTIVHRDASMTVVDFEFGKRVFWGVRNPVTETLGIYLQVPSGTAGSQEIRGKHFLPVATKADLDALLKLKP